MAEKVRTAAELEAMSPAEQDALFDSSILTDLDQVPAGFLDKVRARLTERTAGLDSPNQR